MLKICGKTTCLQLVVAHLSNPCTVISQAFLVNAFRWRIRGEHGGNALTSSLGPRDPKRIDSTE